MTPTVRLLRLCAFAALCSVASMRLAAANPVDGTELLSSMASSSSSSSTPGSEMPARPDSATEGSKMSRFLDDFTSAFKQGTAKMKESLENAASSVKDGVLQGYDYVRSKLTGQPPEESDELPAGNGTVATAGSSTAAALTSSSSSSPSTELEKVQPTAATSTSTSTSTSSTSTKQRTTTINSEPVKIVPNDDDDDDERIIFETGNDKDYVGERTQEGGEDERDVTESPPATTSVTLDNRFIIASPLACKSGQEVVNGKCRNVY